MKKLSSAIFSFLCCCFIFAFSLTMFNDNAHAFFPYPYLSAWGLIAKEHTYVTKKAITEIDKELFGVSKLTASMQRALDQINDGNAATDEAATVAEFHFDSEQFQKGEKRILDLLDQVEADMKNDPPRIVAARSKLGGALHTLQDFYAHSNWVEFNGNPNQELARSSFISNVAGTNEETCEKPTLGYLTCLSRKDDYLTTKLTSGYYKGENPQPSIANKCWHGGPTDFPSIFLKTIGINKDSAVCSLSPHALFHHEAVDQAVLSTYQVIREVLLPKLSDIEKRQLLGGGPTIAFAIDTTGSMGDDISYVRSTVKQIIDYRVGTPEEPVKYVLSLFNDPYVGPTRESYDVAGFKSSIDNIPVYGGGDCPEYAIAGIYNALSAIDEGGALFLFTDASAKDSSNEPYACALANKKRIKVYPVLTGSCSPIDPAFTDIASQTGGQLFYLSSRELIAATNLVDVVSRNNAVDILSVADSATGSPITYDVPVDSAMTEVTFSISGTNTMVIKRPDESVVNSGDQGVTSYPLSSGLIRRISNPQSGIWKVTANTGQFTLAVTGQSPLSFDSFRFAKNSDQPPGLFPISGDPVSGSKIQVIARLQGDFDSATFDLRSKRNTKLQQLSLAPTDSSPEQFIGDVSITDQSFVPYVSGTDRNGAPFQRVIPSVYTPQFIEITAPEPQNIKPGQKSTLVFKVKNYGSRNTFGFTAMDNNRYISSVTPSQFTLGTNETINAFVEVTPPTNAQHGTVDTITVKAQGTSNSLLSNSTSVSLFVSESAETAGTPTLQPYIHSQSRQEPDLQYVDIRLINVGPGTGKNIILKALTFKTLQGTGTATYDTRIAPVLPINIGTLNVGESITLRLALRIPSTVSRLSITETGAMEDVDGNKYSFSNAQAVIPK